MVNYRLLFAVLFVIVVFIAGGLLISNQNKSGELEDARALSDLVYTHLRLADERCRTDPGDFRKLSECLEELNEELESVGDVEEEEFQDYDPETNDTGYIILVNEGRKALNSSLFTLYHNRRIADEGCAIRGSIDEGYTCKLTFNESCDSGDVLEVTYDGSRAYLRTC